MDEPESFTDWWMATLDYVDALLTKADNQRVIASGDFVNVAYSYKRLIGMLVVGAMHNFFRA